MRYSRGVKSSDIIRSLRSSRSLTQSELAAKAGISRVVISQYETGAREPSFAAVMRLAAAAGYTLRLTEVPDDTRTAETLQDVLELAESLPSGNFSPLPQSPFPRTIKSV